MDSLTDKLAALDRAGRRRRLRTLESAQGARVTVDGAELINFSSNDYLGLAANPELAAAARQALETRGFGAGSARLLTGNFDLCRDLERALARWLGAEAALVFNSGYLANLAVLPALAAATDRILSDELNHASIIDGCRLSRASVLVYPHGQLDVAPGPRDWIVTESVFSMGGDVADFSALSTSVQTVGATLVVDEAHAIGCYGVAGAGLAPPTAIRIGTLGKALGSYGAFVLGSAPLIDVLLNTARPFIFTTGLPAPVLAASLAGVELAAGSYGDQQRDALGRRIRQLATGLAELDHRVAAPDTAIFPLILGTEQAAVAASAELESEGLLVQAIRPPTVPPGTARLRIVVTAAHSEEDIARLLDGLRKMNLVQSVVGARGAQSR